MKNLNTFEEFLNEASRNKRGNNKINFLKDSTSEVDHTRLVKWMGKNIDSNKYYFEKSKTVGYWILDVEKLSERELKDLLGYLESEKYKFGTQIWLPAYESEMNEGHRPAKVKIPTNANEGVVNENAKAKSLRAEYLSAFTELGELDLEVLLNTDYPIKMVGELLGDVAKLEEEYKEWLDKKKISQDLAFKHERDFLEQPQIRNKANKAFKAREIVLNKTMKNIEKELFSIYPILQTMNSEMGSKAGGGDSPLFSGDFQAGSIGAILGTGIMKSTGGLWVVETPDEDVFDINITPEQAAEYKKYIKNTI